MPKYVPALLTAATFFVSAAASAQQLPALTAEDYARAERFLSYNTQALVDHSAGQPNWLAGDRFWYRTLTAQGSEFILVDPARKTRTPAFDQAKLATALSGATGKTYEASRLPFRTLTFSPDSKTISFAAAGKSWKYDVASGQLSPNTAPAAKPSPNAENEVESPDGKLAAYIKDYNLWVRDTQTNQTTQLTTDGVKDYGYATDNAGWTTSDKPVLRWSPDSRKIATFRQDQRNVGDMYLVTTNVGHPTLKSWKYPLPGDKDVTTIERVVVEVNGPKVVRFQMAPDQHRGTLSDDISSSGTFDDVDWSPDGRELAFVSTSRDHKEEKIRVADAATGAVRDVFSETVATQYESGQGDINWRYLPKTKEVIWYSERDNWGQLYLYDAGSGKVKNQITKGNFVVTRLLKVDEKKRQLYFLADGREPGNPYFTHLYRIGLDGKNLTLLTPEAGNHQVMLSPSGKYFVDTYSQPDKPGVTVLRAADGKLISTLEKTDISRLTATGWKAPTPITVKAQDGQIDLYGLMFTPTNLDPNKKYPIINYIYPGPQGGGVGSWSFAPARNDHQALAELGFVVVVIEGSCNPLRSKSYHDACYGNMAENTLSDQVTGMRQLAQKYPYIDLNRAGIWGHSGGGYATAMAMFRYPDFFKVGISESGNHENRNYEDDWAERYIGLMKTNADGTTSYDNQANATFAKNLKGKLMLAHGLMDNNVPPYNTWLVVEALTKANKSYDLVVFPNAQHGYGTYGPYMMRRRWDYFVQNLAGATPPHDYEMKPHADPRNAVQ
ncbi:DPP IV N-terminal domain-containing protein [Microvirga sp. STS02]|uniref:S9 family peptidase n=1 Tax=Hymenobacter negativus TaxID=2795026 RepID=UPI0018DD68AE|nr:MULTISPECIES: DPP IV N-terminal domain-containing protein [Bacteria]MBH8568974.1 DPP IV N-terminal domain-containing protein [Hymenobacter negativus]MBR7208709.1 DPP IV N-terminal domain-containing protein [Microvirga sp. STS02]